MSDPDTSHPAVPSPQDLNLRFYPDPVLLRRTRPVENFDEDLAAAVSRMFEVMYLNGGIGLAAPQVGWDARVFVVNLTSDPAASEEEMVFINPRISDGEGESSLEEGCLSFPGVRLTIHRHEKIRVAARDLKGQAFSDESDGLLARCIQHEYDHLDGILFTTRVSVTRRVMLRKQLKELEKSFKERTDRK